MPARATSSLPEDLLELPETEEQWVELLSLLPGYDPFRDSEGFVFDADKAIRAISFFHECLRHIEGALAGKPFILERWEQCFLANLFGWVDDRGLRRFREALLYVPRKNGKSPFAAGICVFILFCDGELGATCFSAASSREQADILFRHAAGMVDREPELSSRGKVYRGQGQRAIVYEAEGSSYKIIPAEAGTQHGQNPHLVEIDELHAQPDRELVDVLRTSFASANRLQSLLLYITTADFDRPSICNEIYREACAVRDGASRDARFLPAIYEAEKGDDWTSEEVWAKANPNLGVSVSLEYLQRACEKAKQTPSYENTFRRLHLNQRTEQADRWMQLQLWDACGGEVLDSELAGAECWIGLDLSSTRDITAMVGAFKLAGGRFALRTRFWVPAENIELRSIRDGVPYDQWAKEGWITPTEGDVVDYDRVRGEVPRFVEGYRARLREVGIDPWNATQLATQLEADGAPVVHVRQGYKTMSPAMKEMERQIVGRTMLHGGNPVLRWMASNVAVVEDDAGNIKPSKKHSIEKIDGIVALAIAVGRAALADGDGQSVYSKRGIIQL